MSFKPGDTVRLKGSPHTWVVLHVYDNGKVPEAMIEIAPEAWGRGPKLVPLADLTLITDLEDFD